MTFSDRFNICKDDLREYGAVDISLDIDLPFFIDPMLLYYSENEEYQKQHESIIAYFAFLSQLTATENGWIKFDELFQCGEIPNNWFGFCYSGNKGKGSSRNFSNLFFSNLTKLYNSTTSSISHFEHIFLFGEYVGKDRISDLCVNLLLEFLANYTQTFVQKYKVNPELCDSFPITFNQLNNSTGDYEKVTHHYNLPYREIELTKKREYILLTPLDIVRTSDPTLNPKDFANSYDRTYQYLSLSNPELRNALDMHFQKLIKLYLEKHPKKKGVKDIAPKIQKRLKKEAIINCSHEKPEVIKAYVEFESNNPERKRANLLITEQERILKIYLFGILPELIISQLKEEKIEEIFQNQPLLSSNVIATQKIISILQAIQKINFNNIVSEKVSQPDINRIIKLIQIKNQTLLLRDIRYECKIARNMHNLSIVRHRNKIDDDFYSIVICYNEEQKDTVQEKLKMKELDFLIGKKIFILKVNYENNEKAF